MPREYVGMLLAGSTVLLYAALRRRRRRAPSARSPSLEVCVDSVASARAAEAGGAARLELCDNLVEGGTTPSVGKVTCCVRHVSIPVHAMVRPRGGDFLYSAEEVEVMLEDVAALKAAGAHGIVVGALRVDGSVDEPLLRRLVAAAAPLPVTFHRAIDVTADLEVALHACRRCGISRVLTSGGGADAMSGAAMLRRMVETSGDALLIAAGGGLTERNAADLVRATGVREVHGSLRHSVPSAMRYRRDPPVYMGAEKLNRPEVEFEVRVTQREKVAAVVSALEEAAARAPNDSR